MKWTLADLQEGYKEMANLNLELAELFFAIENEVTFPAQKEAA